LLELVRASSNVPGVCRGYLTAIWGFSVVCKDCWKVPRIAGVSQGFLEYATSVSGLLDGDVDFPWCERTVGRFHGLLELVTASSNVPGVCRGYWMAIWGFPWCASTVGEFHGLLS